MGATPKRVVFQVMIVYALGVLGAMTVSEAVPVLEAIAREFHPRSGATIGLIMTLPSLVVALGALATGYFVDRFGDKPVLMLGSATLILGDVLVLASRTMTVLLSGRALSGLGYVLMAVSAITLLIRITSGKQRTMALALWSTFVPVSFIVPFLTAGLVAFLGSWRYAFAEHAVLIALATVLVASYVPAREPSVEGVQFSRTAGLGAVLRSPWPYLLGVSFGADAFLHTGIISTLAPYLHTRYGADIMRINGLNIVAMVANAAGCLLLGKLLNRDVSPIRVCTVAILLAGIPGLMLYGLPLGTGWSVACSWIFMFGSGILTGMWAFVPSVAPSPASIGATGGLITQLTLFGVLLSGPAFFSAEVSPNPRAMLGIVAVALVFCLFRGPILLRGGMSRLAAASAASAGHG